MRLWPNSKRFNKHCANKYKLHMCKLITCGEAFCINYRTYNWEKLLAPRGLAGESVNFTQICWAVRWNPWGHEEK
jgi:hypothetical protein